MKSKSLNKETLFTASRKLLFFWRGAEQFIFLLKITAELFRSNLTVRFTSEGAASQGQGFARMLKAFMRQGSSDGGRACTSSKWDLKSKLIMMLVLLPSFCLYFILAPLLVELKQLIFLNKQTAWWFVTLLGYLGLSVSLSGPAQLGGGRMCQLGWKYSINK